MTLSQMLAGGLMQVVLTLRVLMSLDLISHESMFLYLVMLGVTLGPLSTSSTMR